MAGLKKKKMNAAQRLFEAFFHGPVTYARVGKRKLTWRGRHQGVKECARRVRQRANGTHGL